MTDKHAEVRREYANRELRRSMLLADPLAQFEQWLNAAAHLVDATAMTLATVDASGQPSARVVLLKHHDANGFVFYTDYRSQKGLELAANPKAGLLFYWRELERQVRVTGEVVKVSRADGGAYFLSRPEESQVSARASEQSTVIDSRGALEAKAQAARQQDAVTVPEAWGGYRLAPTQYEFWQGRDNRLHDRFRYRQTEAGWLIDRLQP